MPQNKGHFFISRTTLIHEMRNCFYAEKVALGVVACGSKLNSVGGSVFSLLPSLFIFLQAGICGQSEPWNNCNFGLAAITFSTHRLIYFTVHFTASLCLQKRKERWWWRNSCHHHHSLVCIRKPLTIKWLLRHKRSDRSKYFFTLSFFVPKIKNKI